MNPFTARNAWLATMVAGFVLMAASLALRWWVGAWIALAIGLAFSIAFWRLHSDVERERRRWQRTLDGMQTAIALWDSDDRLLFANADFRRVYGLAAEQLVPGQSFEQVLRERVAAGAIPEAVGREEAWIAERLAQHRRNDGTPMLRRLPGDRWRRISEQRLASGHLLSWSIDVTDLVERERELTLARADSVRAHRLLAEAIEAMPAAVELYDHDDRLVMFNRRMLALYPHMVGQSPSGETFDTLVRRALAEGRVPEAAGREEAWLAERLAGRGRSAEPRLQRAPDGGWIHIYETPMAGGGIVAVRLDASEIVRQREALQAARDQADASRATLTDAIEALPDAFALFDAGDRLVLCNQRYRDIYLESAPAMHAGASFEQIVRYGLERGQYPQAEGDPEGWLAERLRRHRASDGVPILQELRGNRWLRIDERRTRSGGIAGVRTDVTELVRTRQELERLSTTDALTGVANRRRFDAALAQEVARAHRHGTPLALLLVDVDHFKLYNDHHGHPQGDRALRAVADVLAQQARRPGELLARYGGEEFALLLPQADAATARAVAERCLDAMAALGWPHGSSPTGVQLTLSIGVAMLESGARERAHSLLARADAALYAAKSQGRARCVVAAED